MARPASFRLIVLGVVLVAVIVVPWFLPIQKPMQELLTWVQAQGVWGLVVLAAVWIPAAILLIPGTLITLAGGAIFGVMEGTVAISLGSTAGACAAFLVGRGVARPWVARQVAANLKFQAIDQAIGEQGFKIVLLLRLSPVFPYNLLNYALALTRVPFRDYFLASWIGMLPGTMMYVYIGSTVGELAALSAKRGWSVGEWVFFLVGLALTIVATVYITRVANRALRRAIEQAKAAHPVPAGESHV